MKDYVEKKRWLVQEILSYPVNTHSEKQLRSMRISTLAILLDAVKVRQQYQDAQKERSCC